MAYLMASTCLCDGDSRLDQRIRGQGFRLSSGSLSVRLNKRIQVHPGKHDSLSQPCRRQLLLLPRRLRARMLHLRCSPSPPRLQPGLSPRRRPRPRHPPHLPPPPPSRHRDRRLTRNELGAGNYRPGFVSSGTRKLRRGSLRSALRSERRLAERGGFSDPFFAPVVNSAQTVSCDSLG